jgi:hypothetical protein
MRCSQVGAHVQTTELERDDVVDREGVAGPGRQTAEPTDRLLSEHLPAQALVCAVVPALGGRASTTVVGPSLCPAARARAVGGDELAVAADATGLHPALSFRRRPH